MHTTNLMATCKVMRDDLYHQIYQSSLFTFLFDIAVHPKSLFLNGQAFGFLTHITFGPIHRFSTACDGLIALWADDAHASEMKLRVLRLAKSIDCVALNCPRLTFLAILLSEADVVGEWVDEPKQMTYPTEMRNYYSSDWYTAWGARRLAQRHSTAMIWWKKPDLCHPRSILNSARKDTDTTPPSKVAAVLGSKDQVVGAKYVKFALKKNKEIVAEEFDLPKFDEITNALQRLKSSVSSLRWIGYGVEREVCIVPV